MRSSPLPPKSHTTTSHPETKCRRTAVCPPRGRAGAPGAPHPRHTTFGERQLSAVGKIRTGSRLLIRRQNPPSFPPHALFEATETAALPPAPFLCAVPALLQVFLLFPRRVSLPFRPPPAVFCLGLPSVPRAGDGSPELSPSQQGNSNNKKPKPTEKRTERHFYLGNK